MVFLANRFYVKWVLAVFIGLSVSTQASSKTFQFEELFDAQPDEPSTASPVIGIELGPNLLAKFEAAQALLLDSKFTEAEPLVREVTEDAPNGPAGWHLLGLVLANQNRFDEALEALGTAGNLYTQTAEPFIVQGDILLALGRRDEAREAYRTAVGRDPANWRGAETAGVLAQEDGDTAEAEELLRIALQTAPRDRLFTRLRLAGALLDTERPGEAAKLLETFVSENPEDLQALAALGHANLAAGGPDDAVSAFQRAVDQLPENASLNLFLGQALLSAGNVVAAESAMLTAQRLEPDAPGVYLELGNLYGATRDYEQALEKYRTGIDLQADAPQLLRGARLAAYRLERREVALDYAQSVAAMQGATSQDFFWLGLLEQQTGNAAKAERAYEIALELDPSNWITANNLAVLITETDPTRALDLAASAEVLKPDSTDVQATLGWANYHAGNLSEAEAIYQNLVMLAEPKPHHIYRLGVIFLEQGKRSEGRSQLEAALALDSDFEGADDARARLAN